MIEKLFDTHVRVRASGNLDKVKSIKSQSDYIFLESTASDGKRVWVWFKKVKNRYWSHYMTIKSHLIEYFIIIMHASSQAVSAAAELHHSSQLTESRTTRKNEAYLMVLARTRPYFIILMVRKHRSALCVQMCPVKFLQRSWEKYKQHEGERVLTVTALLLAEFCVRS